MIQEISHILTIAPELLEIQVCKVTAHGHGIRSVLKSLIHIQIIRLQHTDHQMQHRWLLHCFPIGLQSIILQSVRRQVKPLDGHRYFRKDRAVCIISSHIGTILRQ